jgi:flagellar basal-body rod modification protein FlgD
MVTKPVMVREASAASSSAASSSDQQLDRSAFLKLLVTQLQNQDPLKPMDDTAFIAQLAQFSSLEQMQQVNSALTLQQLTLIATQAMSLVGHKVSYLKDGSSEPTEGTVKSVRFDKDGPKLLIGDDEVSLASVSQVW